MMEMVKFFVDAWFIPIQWNVCLARMIWIPVQFESKLNKKRVALVACVKQKKQGIHPAQELFTSAWFVKAKEYVENVGFDDWYILSAKYHVVSPDEMIEYYPEHLNQYRKEQIDVWAKTTAGQIEDMNLSNEQLYIIGSEKYRTITSYLPESDIIEPLKGMGISQQLSWMNRQAKKEKTAD